MYKLQLKRRGILSMFLAQRLVGGKVEVCTTVPLCHEKSCDSSCESCEDIGPVGRTDFVDNDESSHNVC